MANSSLSLSQFLGQALYATVLIILAGRFKDKRVGLLKCMNCSKGNKRNKVMAHYSDVREVGVLKLKLS